MHVAFTVEQCWHDVPGGTAVAALGLARALAARADLSPVGVSAWHRAPPPPPFVPPIPVRSLPVPRRVLYEAWRRIGWPPVEWATGPVDVVHGTTIIVPPRRSSPLIVTLHDLAFLHEPQQFNPHGVLAFTAGLDRVKRYADLVLCSSQATLDDAVRAGIGPERLRLVPLGIDPVTTPTTAEVDEVRRRFGLDDPYLLFVGTLEPRKNLARLVEAVELLPPGSELVIVGPDGWGGQARPASPRVRRLGFVDEPTKSALYAGADVVCYPSIREGFGLPVLEAMARGAPVVTSRGTATAEVAGEAAVLVDPFEPKAIADGIREALGRREELALAGPLRAAAYTWDATAELVVAAYREVAG